VTTETGKLCRSIPLKAFDKVNSAWGKRPAVKLSRDKMKVAENGVDMEMFPEKVGDSARMRCVVRRAS